jgi:hypothetical protein
MAGSLVSCLITTMRSWTAIILIFLSFMPSIHLRQTVHPIDTTLLEPVLRAKMRAEFELPGALRVMNSRLLPEKRPSLTALSSVRTVSYVCPKKVLINS